MTYEKLYLSKSKSEFIHEEAAVKLLQHQRDGVRFLYEQYAKNKQGVILNDPCGSGRSLQVLLFLHAIRHTVSEPVLVLTEHVDTWKDLIFTWTESSHEVSFQSSLSPPTKKIYISCVGDISSLKRHQWSVLVLDHDECSGRLMKQLNVMQARYKVVVTAVDLKENIKTFAAIYEWMHPAGRFNVSLFLGGERSRKQLAQRYRLLDCYFEGVVLRRPEVVLLPPDKPKQPIAPPPSPQKVTRKNKDITGTKIKRTKRKVESETEAASTSNPTEQNIHEEPRQLTDDEIFTTEVEAMDYKDNAADLKRNHDIELGAVTKIPKKRERLISYDFDDNIIRIIEGEIKSVDISDADADQSDKDKSKIEEEKTGRLQTRYAIDVGAFISSQQQSKHLYTDNDRINIESVNTSNEFQCSVKETDDENNKADDEALQKDNKTKVEDVSSHFDDKMKALQKKTQMKFKGSLLDSIF